MPNKIIKRKCIVTGEIKPVDEMIRIVKTNSDNFIVNSNSLGRGAYISKNKDLIPIITRKKSLNRAFKTQVDNTVYKELFKILEGGKEDGR